MALSAVFEYMCPCILCSEVRTPTLVEMHGCHFGDGVQNFCEAMPEQTVGGYRGDAQEQWLEKEEVGRLLVVGEMGVKADGKSMARQEKIL